MTDDAASSLPRSPKTISQWVRFCRSILLYVAALGVILCAVIIWSDPYGVRARTGSSQPVLMDSNQRFMYPQLVRSGRFDAAIIGTSSSRLLDPERLSTLFDMRFVNLAMNAATPWEQSQMMALIAQNWIKPKAIIWGLDATWCESDADTAQKRLTPRPFPEWLYQRQPSPSSTFNMVLQLPHVMNLATLETAGKRALHAVGQLPPRMRSDGFDEFTPPDATYDAARARFHLYRHNGGSRPASLRLDALISDNTQTMRFSFPALDWLEARLAALPGDTRKMIVLPPLHAASVPEVETELRLSQATCKAALVAIASRVNATLLDYRQISALTLDDRRFWDPLHYRIDVARRIENDLAAADRSGKAISADAKTHFWQSR